MQAVSNAFLRRIAESGKRKTVVDLYDGTRLVAAGLPVSGGTIRVDLNSEIRRSGSITIADPSLVPLFGSGQLSPLGPEIVVRQGVVFANGSEELVPVGRFRLETTDFSDAEGSVPTIQIYDRGKGLQVDLPPTLSYSGKWVKVAVVDLLSQIYPNLGLSVSGVFDSDVTDYRLPGGHSLSGGTYASAIVELCANVGGEFGFDASGWPRVKAIPDLVDLPANPVHTFGVGPGGVLVKTDHSYSRDGVYNAVTVVGMPNDDDVAPTATAKNTNPASPLRWDGPLGRVPLVINDQSLTSRFQCSIRAMAELAKYTGAQYSVDFGAVPNPAIEEGDVIRFEYLNGTAEIHQITNLSIPLGPGDYSGSTRAIT